jgi:hypothetical protein
VSEWLNNAAIHPGSRYLLKGLLTDPLLSMEYRNQFNRPFTDLNSVGKEESTLIKLFIDGSTQ